MTTKKGTMEPEGVAEAKPIAEARDASVLYEYAAKCNVSLVKDLTIKISWDNGHAYGATRGATLDYVAKHMFIHLQIDDKAYDMAADYRAMTDGGVAPKLAWIVCMIRRVAMSAKGVPVLASETVWTNKAAEEFDIAQDVMDMIKDHGPAVNAIVQQTFSIMALNGQQLIAKGHHYTSEDQAFDRLVTATGMDQQFAALRINNWTGALFHDALHPLDYDWVAAQVVTEESGLRQKVHGVANTRMNTLPAGTTHLGLAKPLQGEIAIRNAELAAFFDDTLVTIDKFITMVRKKPLDYCVHFQRAGTAERLQELGKFEVIVAFMAGYLQKLGVRKASVMAAKSLNGIMTRHGPAAALGAAATVPFDVKDKTKDEIMATLRGILDINVDDTKFAEAL